MPEVLVRDLDPLVIRRLKTLAREHQRSLQAELKTVLEREAESAVSMAEFRKEAARLRRRLAGRRHTDSATLQAAGRRR
ncbi:MAG: hypothetical protein HY236_08845 [Acidobacteria bacterium]|nr:hypothetical protein [Acidobacteriota bacterium]